MRSASDQLLSKPRERTVQATVGSSVFNMTNMIIGAGVLALPYAFRAAGVLPALGVCLSVWLASSYSFILLARCAEKLEKYSYKNVALETLGDGAAIFSESVIMLYTIGNLIGRQIILGDLLPPIFQAIVGTESFYAQRSMVLWIVNLTILIPVSLSPYIDSLKWSSLFGLMCMCYVVCLFVVTFTGNMAIGNIEFQSCKSINPSLLSLMAFPLLVVSFTAHYNTFDMYWELKDRSIERMKYVVSTSTGICLAVYIIVGLSGYLLFMEKTQPNILVNLWTDRNDFPGIFTATAFLAISVAVSLSYPLVCHGARGSVKKLLFTRVDMEAADGINHVLITISIIILSLLVGLYIPDIGIIFAFMGSTVGVCFVYVLPGLFYIETCKIVSRRDKFPCSSVAVLELSEKTLDDKEAAQEVPDYYGPRCLIVFGTLIGVMGTIATSLHVSGMI
mmetsp:Transcript_4755/g.7061  ORF Transcript_4755/g.7061 Transcript_4755/m.7061 type:complete len:448 (+) Transcript_4755:155-1498(+)